MGIMKNKLPIMQSDSEQFLLMQTRWASVIEPLLSNPIVNGAVLRQVSLVSGANVINHKLGRKLQGWLLARKRGAAEIYDTQDSNNMPNLTLTLTSDAVVSVDLYVW